MEPSTEAMTRVDHRKLRRLLVASFEKFGVPKSDAEIAANGLVMADLRGVDTHGVIRVNPHSWYIKWLSEGSMKAKPDIKTSLRPLPRRSSMATVVLVWSSAIGRWN